MKKYIVDTSSLGINRLCRVLEEGKLPIIGVSVSPDVENYDDLCALVLNSVRKVSDIPVCKGAQRPLLDKRYTEGRLCPAATTECDFYPGHRVDFIARAAEGEDEIEIICLDALSNVALAIMKNPESMMKVKRVYVAGGALLGYTTTTPTSHHNILADREAARTVFDSGLDITLIPAHISDDFCGLAFRVAADEKCSVWSAYLSVDVGTGFTRGQTIIDTVGRNPINGETAKGKMQTVVMAAGL